MKQFLILFTAICMAQSCDIKVAKPTIKTIKPASRFANAKDYNCGMDTDDAYTDTTVYNGKVYGFCSATCKKAFDKEPEKFTGK
jgi:YHS domain-containing protein